MFIHYIHICTAHFHLWQNKFYRMTLVEKKNSESLEVKVDLWSTRFHVVDLIVNAVLMC